VEHQDKPLQLRPEKEAFTIVLPPPRFPVHGSAMKMENCWSDGGAVDWLALNDACK